MLTKNINLKNFSSKKPNKKIFFLYKKLLNEDNEILKSFKTTYQDSFTKKKLVKYKNFFKILIIGMGGSILGSRSIYNFLKKKIKKNFYFQDNLEINEDNLDQKKRSQLNIVISKSGNTLETISNLNLSLKKRKKKLFITENKKSYLIDLANKLKSEVIYHNNFIGGRYSVLSEVGMLPAELMGLKVNKFRRFNLLMNNKYFVNNLIKNVSCTLDLIKKKKFNSIILNYDESSTDIFFWYQQLIAESLGKKSKGILPIISNMPKDNHSLMQLYLDGPKQNFFTFFFVNDISKDKIRKTELLNSYNYLKNKSLIDIKKSQYRASEKIFKKKNIPFRSFVIKKRNEETLGELFVFFMLETILLARALGVNPYDQPSVELIKTETKKFIINS